MSRKSMYFKMILSSILRRKSRMAVAVLAIAIGATILSGLMTIYYDIPRQLGKEFRSYGANLAVLPSNNTKISNLDIEKIKNLVADKSVGIAPYRYHTTKINEQPYILAGTDLTEAKKNSPFWHIDGKWLDNSQNDRAMIGKEIAKKLDLKVSDSFTVQGVKFGNIAEASSQNASAEENKKRNISDKFFSKKFYVEGIVTTGGAEEEFVFININSLYKLIGAEDGCDMIECSIEANGDELIEISNKISENVKNVVARPVKRVTQSQDIVLGKLQALVYIVTIVVLIITMISVSTTMMAMIVERRKEIGLKKALGAENSMIIKEFLGEGVALGIIGGILGVIMGFQFAQGVSLNVFGRAITMQWALIPVTIVISAVITAIASIWPIRKVLDIHPAIVLKGE